MWKERKGENEEEWEGKGEGVRKVEADVEGDRRKERESDKDKKKDNNEAIYGIVYYKMCTDVQYD